MINIVCTDCGGQYTNVYDAKAHADRLAFPVSFALVDA